MVARALCLALTFVCCAGGRVVRAASAPLVAIHVNPWNRSSDLMLVDSETLTLTGTCSTKGSASPLLHQAGTETLSVIVTKARAASLWSIDATGSCAPVAELDRDVVRYIVDDRTNRLYAVAGRKKSKPKIITTLNLAAGQRRVFARVERMTGIELSPDGRLLYALCEGKPHKKPEGLPGSVHVFETATGIECARLDGGRTPTSVAFDPANGLVYVLGATDAQGSGVLTVIRGNEVLDRLATPGVPTGLRLAPDGSAFVLTSRAVIALERSGTRAATSWDLDFGPSDLVFDPAHDLMFAGAGAGSKIAEMRMSGGDMLAEHATGSAGRKLGKGVGQAVYVLFAIAAAMGGAPVGGPIPGGQSSTSMVLGEGGSTLYVLNPYTNDVSLFNVAKQDVVDIVHVGGSCRRIVQLPGERDFWVEAGARLARFNTTTNRIDRTVDFHGLVNHSVAYDLVRKRAWISMGAKILVVDLRTGEAVGQVDLPKGVATVWYEPSADAMAH